MAMMYLTSAGPSQYPYRQHLQELDSRSGVIRGSIPHWLQTVSTPLRLEAWREALQGHPDPVLVAYVLGGIQRGFRIGFRRSAHYSQASSNMKSAIENVPVVSQYIEEERRLGRLVGPIPPHMAPSSTQLSPIGVIPKSSQPGKWRLIVDLSSPHGVSVNDGIEPDLCSLEYLRLDEVTARIAKSGRGTMLAKMDVASAYRMVPVHPEDRPLLAIQWAGQLYYDTRLPFGLRSAPKIFTAVADALQWVFEKQGVSWVAHYLDDYITMGPPGSNTCAHNLEVMLSTCVELGVPTAPGKCAGPASSLVFLGFELDTEALVVRLPTSKLEQTQRLVREWLHKRACKKRELESLLGHLQHAATVVRPGRTFVRRLIELLSVVQSRDRWVRINGTVRSDLIWWDSFMAEWNGVAVIPRVMSLQTPLISDASGNWGCGALWATHWFQWKWEGRAVAWSIAPKELLPIIFGLAVWGKQWVGSRIECHCDNAAVVAAVNSGKAKDPTLMHLLRCMFFIASHYSVHVHATHIPGQSNTAADALSRNRISSFLQVVPAADADPTPIPQGLLDMTVREQPDWTSPQWARLFSACCRQD